MYLSLGRGAGETCERSNLIFIKRELDGKFVHPSFHGIGVESSIAYIAFPALAGHVEVSLSSQSIFSQTATARYAPRYDFFHTFVAVGLFWMYPTEK